MSETSIKSATEPRAAVPAPESITVSPPPAPTPQPRRKHPVWKALSVLASLRLTVILFALSLFLVFVGTLAQMDASIHAVMGRYFRCLLAWVPLQVFVRFGQVFFHVNKDLVVPGSFPCPGGYIVGGALLVNLVTAHLVRFKLGWKRSGIWLIHFGLILMMLGELFTGLSAVEGNMTIRRHEQSDFDEQHDHAEIALITASKDPGKDDVTVIADSRLRPGTTVSHPDPDRLPFDIEVTRYMPNSLLGVVENSNLAQMLEKQQDGSIGLVKLQEEVPADLRELTDAGLGNEVFGISRPQGTGVDASARYDVPSAYITLKDKTNGKSLGSYFVSAWFPMMNVKPQQVKFEGKTYDLALRFKRNYKNYSITLHDVKAEYYPGTTTPKDYSSQITWHDKANTESVDFRIYMNQPLRHKGETFYQSGISPNVNPDTTILQVVKNEWWLAPYISCVMVSLGMCIHFVLSLSTFLKRRAVA